VDCTFSRQTGQFFRATHVSSSSTAQTARSFGLERIPAFATRGAKEAADVAARSALTKDAELQPRLLFDNEMDQVVWYMGVARRNPHCHIVTHIAYSIADNTDSVLAITEPPKHHLHKTIAAPADDAKQTIIAIHIGVVPGVFASVPTRSVRGQNPFEGGVASWFPARFASGQTKPSVSSDLD
jgi:hypothetical protein